MPAGLRVSAKLTLTRKVSHWNAFTSRAPEGRSFVYPAVIADQPDLSWLRPRTVVARALTVVCGWRAVDCVPGRQCCGCSSSLKRHSASAP